MTAPAAEPRLSETELRLLAEDAREVFLWAMQRGLKKEQQVEQVIRAFEVRLGYREKAEGRRT